MTTIAAITPPSAGVVRRNAAAASPPVEAAEPARAVARAAHAPVPQHQLVDAMNRVFKAAAGGQVGNDEGSQSVLRFAHALMQDLRTLSGEGEADASPRPSAWGDLPQQLSTLATAASRPQQSAAQAQAAMAEVPDQPNPVTTATVAVHIMKVPSSRLLEAFAAMQRALGEQAQSADDPSPEQTRAALADLVRRLAGTVAPASTAKPAGSVLSLKV